MHKTYIAKFKKQFFILIFTMFSIGVFAQNFQWAKRLGEISTDRVKSMALDAAGNIYSTGFFGGTVDFDPGPATFNLTGNGDVFILKLDASGNFLWAKSMGGVQADQSNAIAIDAAGNIYTTGTFLGTADFDPGSSTYNLISAGGGDIFVSKLDANGDFIWAKNMGGTNNDVAVSMAIDASGNIYTSGYFRGTSDFDPGVLTYSLTSEGSTNYDIFISKLDASGNFIWAKNLGGADEDRGSCIALDGSGNVYTTGFFYNAADFDPGASTYTLNTVSPGYPDIFISKLDASGNFVWAKSIGSIWDDRASSVAVDATGNVYTTGYFQETADFDPGPATHNMSTTLGGSDADIFVLKLNSTGDFIWAKTMGGASTEQGASIAIDAFGNVFTTGTFDGTADFDPGPGIYNLTGMGGTSDIFISKLNAAGDFVWAKAMGGDNVEHVYSMILSPSEDIYTAGDFQGTSDFDPGTAIYNLVSFGQSDAFILKLSTAVIPITLLNFELTRIQNDASLTWETATESNTDKFEIERSDDAVTYKKIGSVKASGNSNSIQTYHYSDNNAASIHPDQTLYYRFKQLDTDAGFTYSPVRSLRFKQHSATILINPNPASDVITIQAGNSLVGSPYSIVEQTGRKVLIGKINNINTVVDISYLPAGIYFVQVGACCTKIVKLVNQ